MHGKPPTRIIVATVIILATVSWLAYTGGAASITGTPAGGEKWN